MNVDDTMGHGKGINIISKKSRSRYILKEDRVPEVIVDFEYDNGGLLFVIIQNIGLSSAYQTSIKFDSEITGIGGEKKLTDMSIFKCLEFLPPGKRIRVFVDTFLSYLNRKQPLVVNTTISYSNKSKQKIQEIIKHDLSIYKGIVDIV